LKKNKIHQPKTWPWTLCDNWSLVWTKPRLHMVWWTSYATHRYNENSN
jgi:hypothetical protein